VHIEVVPGSATPKTPAAQSQQILDMAKANFFTPQGLPVLKIVAEMLGFSRSDTFLDRVDEVYAQIQSSAPDPNAVAQQKIASDQMSAQAEQQHAGVILAAQTHAHIEEIQAKAQADIEVERAKAAFQAQARAALSAQDHAETLTEQANQHLHEAALVHVEKHVPGVGAPGGPHPGFATLLPSEREKGL
jgi:hypothetical protein